MGGPDCTLELAKTWGLNFLEIDYNSVLKKGISTQLSITFYRKGSQHLHAVVVIANAYKNSKGAMLNAM